MRAGSWTAAAVLLLSLQGAGSAPPSKSKFEHETHRKLFPTCLACHRGIVNGERPWPDPEGCRACHDGVVQEPIEWAPPAASPPSNLRFQHGQHVDWAARRDTVVGCSDCHTPTGSPWMTVRRAVTGQCLSCHGIATEHLEAPDSTCRSCHLPLVEAVGLTMERVSRFPEPRSHRREGFATGEGHGALATRVAGAPVAPSCATCHARDFCLVCHVNAPEVAAIQALREDPRSLALRATLEPPESHRAADFGVTHGGAARQRLEGCVSCHTRESCLSCHRAVPEVVARLPAAGPGRGVGAKVVRRPPASHGDGYVERHSTAAAVRSQTCAGCHVQADCLQCHRPEDVSRQLYHGDGFLSRHPAAAYSRAADCAGCHNPGEFCASCHQQAGLVAKGVLRSGYHDAKQMFAFGHGEAARRSLESCVSCHAERDCLTCHSALGGRRFNPHGPDFDAARLRKLNPGMCTVCHGGRIPGP